MNPSPAFDELLVVASSWLIAGCACWAVLISAAAVLEALSSGRLRATSWVGCPPALRRALLAALGVALVSTPGPVSAAAPTSASTGRPLPVPDRTSGLSRAALPVHVVVRPGDSLWHLAQTRLPRASPAGEVAVLVDRLHRRNREVIGPEPDLIRPGQRLSVPPVPHQRSRHHEESR